MSHHFAILSFCFFERRNKPTETRFLFRDIFDTDVENVMTLTTLCQYMQMLFNYENMDNNESAGGITISKFNTYSIVNILTDIASTRGETFHWDMHATELLQKTGGYLRQTLNHY